MIPPRRSTRLFDGKHLRAELTVGASTDLIVTFDHWRRDRTGFPAPHDPDFWTERGLSHLNVQSAANDWFFNEETADLIYALEHVRTWAGTVRTIGASMGAYAALLFSESLGASCSLLSSPQSGAVLDQSTDVWAQDYAAACARGLLDLTTMNALSGAALLLFDPTNASDAFHARAIARANPVLMIERAGAGHPAAFGSKDAEIGLRNLMIGMSAGTTKTVDGTLLRNREAA